MLRRAYVMVLMVAGVFPTLAHATGNQETLKATVVEGSSLRADTKSDNGQKFGTVVCQQGGHKRIVALTSQDANGSLPCEVHYRKESEQPGHDQLIYSAQSEFSYCEDKARDFVKKLEGWGWVCS